MLKTGVCGNPDYVDFQERITYQEVTRGDILHPKFDTFVSMFLELESEVLKPYNIEHTYGKLLYVRFTLLLKKASNIKQA